ncbi:MAG: glutamate--tRNA ligase, partial [Arcobacter sp.]|nr:glutamate--tRNA ligase [Arcobacter sp.]
DTDNKRSHIKYINNILDILKWLNLSYDNLFFQSGRGNIYRFYLEELLKNGKAYKCFCAKSRLDDLKNKQLLSKSKIMYDGFCKDKIISNSNSDFVIRFSVDNKGFTEFNDIIKCKVILSNYELDDFIISKNYNPTYNFASVVDDIECGITDIIRGEDHISNTQKQIIIFNSFEKKIPNFAHLPMILDSDKKKMSKRNNYIYMSYYLNHGFLPMAILNYIFKLGFSYKDFEFFNLDDMINYFDLSNVGKSPSSFDLDKLLFLNKYYMKISSSRKLLYFSIPILKQFNFDFFCGPKILDLLDLNKNRFSNLYDLYKESFFFYSVKVFDVAPNVLSSNYLYIIKLFYFSLKISFYFWSLNNIKSHLEYFMRENNILLVNFAFILRFILIGLNSSYPVYNLIFLSGKILLLKKIITTLKRMGL